MNDNTLLSSKPSGAGIGMISMLCLGSGTSASMLSCIPAILSNSKRNNLHFSFGGSFTSPSNVHPRQRALHISCPVICALEGSPIPWKNEKNNNRSARKIAGVSLALACAIGIITAGFKMNPKAIAGPRELFQKSSPTPMVTHATTGKDALESLLDVPASLASDEVEPPDMKFRLPINPSMEEVNAIKVIHSTLYIRPLFESFVIHT